MTRRLLMTADAVGGVWTYVLELTAALAPLGWEVHLATMGPGPTSDQRDAAIAHGVASLHTSSFALEWMADPWTEVQDAGEWLLLLEAELVPDVVHLNGFALAALPWLAPVVVVAHSCVFSWWEALHRHAPPPEWATYRERVRRGLDAASAVVAPTTAMLSALNRWYGPVSGDVIPNGRRSDWAHPLAKEPYVLGAGRVWDGAKALDRLARAAERVPWPVYIAGDDGGCPPPGAARQLGRLSFDDLAVWLLRASIFAAPSCYEPFGLGPLEAAIAGCALVLGDIPSLREVWGDAGSYVEPGNDDHLVEVVVRLTGDEAGRHRLARRARRRAVRYTPERMGDAYAALYMRLSDPLLVRP
jgi:glycogen synthase